MVEPEAAFMDIIGDMNLAEDFLKFLLKKLLEKLPADMQFFNERIEPTLLETLSGIIEQPFARITYSQAVEILEKSGESFDYPVKWGLDLQSEHERYLTEKHIKRPVIVTDYPKTIKAFYMYLNDDDKTVRGMDVLVPRIGEIIGGSERECRTGVLRERMREMQLKEDNYQWYLDLRRFGSAPHAGFGLGFERFIQFVTGMQNIRDVIPFPRFPGHAG